MTRRPRELADRFAIPIEAQPVSPSRIAAGVFGGGAGAVRILDPEQELAAPAAGEKPVEQRRPRAADMQLPGGEGQSG